MRYARKYFVPVFFFIFFALILTLRLFSDHTQNLHYTGDYLAEKILVTTADNFEKFGGIKTRFMPIFETMPDGPQTSESLKPYFYTHYPALPYWVFGAVYLLFDHSEMAARIAAIFLSLLGLVFAVKAVFDFQSLAQKNNLESEDQTALFFIVFVLLAFSPSFLCFADNIQQLSFSQFLQFASFFWCVRYLFFRASLGWGILLYFLHVWVSFEWLVPLFFITCFCIWKREGNLFKKPAPWLCFFFLGFLLPILLRVIHNAWALGGVQEALFDLSQRAKTRSLGNAAVVEMSYSFAKHLAKIFFGLLWFAGLSAILIIGVCFSNLRDIAKQNRLLFQFLALWGLASISWQFLMPQNAMVHAYSQMHIADFILLTAAICAVLCWREKKSAIIALMLIYCVGAGLFIKSELFLPFASQTVRQLAEATCPTERQNLKTKISQVESSMARQISKELSAAQTEPACTSKSKAASATLSLYTYAIKSRLSP
ncbi:MAG: hypothetical protein Q7T03_08490 [Deltaproteobacteria bacterium]|nr:hypothetical protein [Deltaproteobacteria bacterium]